MNDNENHEINIAPQDKVYDPITNPYEEAITRPASPPKISFLLPLRETYRLLAGAFQGGVS